MPELPEVETTRRGLAPHILDRRVRRVVVRESRLRWPISPRLATELKGQRLLSLERRAKYLLLGAHNGSLILHLGMSGSLRMVSADSVPREHDHVDIVLDGARGLNVLRFHDPRRFGAAIWTRAHPLKHKLLRDLGPEPVGPHWGGPDRRGPNYGGPAFDGAHLHTLSRGRKVAVKNFIMDAHVVVGVGNIYASEALFLAGIRPHRPAGKISLQRYSWLARAIRRVLGDAIKAGGTTLRDYVREDGTPGYFALHLRAYDREGEPCERCGTAIRREIIGQRSSFFCGRCQR
ncbi:MAG: bifunctional DNA-formamidopyrimidine glycosylase/DNA-(apurinic or apyrimidinic site) lyase [Gammaproteobacteria bacterium]